MSSLSYDNISVIARRRLNAPDSLRFQPLVDQALISLARKVARRDDFTQLRKEVAVTVTSGVITLSDTSLLIEMIDKTGTLILNSKETKWLPTYNDLRSRLPTDIYWAAMRNGQIHVKDVSTGNLGSASTTGTLDASYVPTLAQLPVNYEEEIVDEVIKLAQGRVDTEAESIIGKQDDATNVRLIPNN